LWNLISHFNGTTQVRNSIPNIQNGLVFCIFHAIGNVRVRFIPTKCTGRHVSADKRSLQQGLYTEFVLN